MPDIGSQTIVNGPIAPEGLTGQEVAQSYWTNGDVLSDWLTNKDTYGHNEALAAYERERAAAKEAWERESTYNAQEAEKQRQYEAYMSNTAFQRKIADYEKAGFSPLAALEGSVGASTPSGSAASASAKGASSSPGQHGANGLGTLLGSIIGAVALIATKGISGIAQKANSAKASEDLAKKLLSNEKINDAKIAAYKEVHSASWAKKVAEVAKDAVQEDPDISKAELEHLVKVARTRWVRE